jgi:hypothetical protein
MGLRTTSQGWVSSLTLSHSPGRVTAHAGNPVILQKYGTARVDDARAAALEMEVTECRFVRRHLEPNTQPPLRLVNLEGSFGNSLLS